MHSSLICTALLLLTTRLDTFASDVYQNNVFYQHIVLSVVHEHKLRHGPDRLRGGCDTNKESDAALLLDTLMTHVYAVDELNSAELWGLHSILSDKQKCPSCVPVTVRFPDPQGGRGDGGIGRPMCIIGSWSEWLLPHSLSRNKDGEWETTLLIPPGEYGFKILNGDGRWFMTAAYPTQNDIFGMKGKTHMPILIGPLAFGSLI